MPLIYKGKIVTLKTEKVCFKDGHTSFFEFVLHDPAVGIVPLIEKDSILLVRQFRPVVKEKVWEIPAGIMDKKETPLQSARRELEEETGLKAKKMIPLGTFYSSPGFTSEMTTIFLSEDHIETKQKLDRDEEIEIRILPLKTVKQWIKKGKLKDAKTILAVLLTENYLRDKGHF